MMAADCKIEWVAELARQRGMAPKKWGPVTSEKQLKEPLRWCKPAVVFAGDMVDLFHSSVTDAMLDRIFAVMALRPGCLFLILTKYPERMRRYLDDAATTIRITSASVDMAVGDLRWSNLCGTEDWWPLPNVWLGVTAEDQAAADARIPHLLATPAAKRFLSCEPLLGPVKLRQVLGNDWTASGLSGEPRGLDWVICGGESGPSARPIHPAWARDLRDQCVAAGAPFFFEQWGEWGHGAVMISTGEPIIREFTDFQHWVNKASTWVNGGTCVDTKGRICEIGKDMMRARDEGAFPVAILHKIGKKAAGRLLDGREWNEAPK